LIDREELKAKGRKLISPIVGLFVALRVPPNALSLIGFILSLGVAYLYAVGEIRWAGVLLFFAGGADAVDGEVARRSGMVSRFGALLDSSLDRMSEFVVFGGLLYRFGYDPFWFAVLFSGLMFSVMVSYLRARGEGLGVSVKAGLMDRMGRYIYLIIASILDGGLFLPLMFIFALLVAMTVVTRWLKLYNNLS